MPHAQAHAQAQHALTRSALLTADSGSTVSPIDTDGYPNPARQQSRPQPSARTRPPRRRSRSRTTTATGISTSTSPAGAPNAAVSSPLDHTANPTRTMGDHERALLLWLQAESLDTFYTDVYNYFYGRGAACISLNRLAMLVRVAISSSLLVFLSSCIDYAKLHHLSGPTPLATVMDPACPRIHPLMRAVLLLGALAWWWSLTQLWRDQVALRKMKDFFTHVLEIPDSDIQTASWSTILARLELLGIHHPHPSHTSRPPALAQPPNTATDARSDQPPRTPPPPLGCSMVEIVARIMRRENYLIALFSTPGLLSLRVPLPVVGPALSPCLTRALQWTIEQCVLGVLFADARLWTNSKAMGNHRQARMRVQRALVEKLKHTLVVAAFASAVLGPLVLVGMGVYLFFRYGDEYYRNPSPLGSRRFTPLATWQTRELNEMPHEHERRLARALVPANKYLNSFPATKLAILVRLVTFTLGALASILLGLSLAFPDTLLHLELTPDRTPVFYLTLLGAALAVARGMRGPDPRVHADPSAVVAGDDAAAAAAAGGPHEYMHELVAHTHVCPRAWALWGFHSDRTRTAVAAMVVPKAMLYVNEMVGVLVAPLVIGVSVRDRAEQIVQFVMERTVVVPGLGCVYEGALFDGRHGVDGTAEVEDGEAVVVELHQEGEEERPLMDEEHDGDEDGGETQPRQTWDALAQQKMTTSVIQFQENHPSWRPPADIVSHLDLIESAFQAQRQEQLNASRLAAERHEYMPRSRFLDPPVHHHPPPPVHVSIYESIMLSPAVRHETLSMRPNGPRSRVTSPHRPPYTRDQQPLSGVQAGDLLSLDPSPTSQSAHQTSNAPALPPPTQVAGRGFVASSMAPPVPAVPLLHFPLGPPSTGPSSAATDGAFVSPPAGATSHAHPFASDASVPIAIQPHRPPSVTAAAATLSPRKSFTGGPSLLSAQLQRSNSVGASPVAATAPPADTTSQAADPPSVLQPPPAAVPPGSMGMMASFGVGSTAVTSEDMVRMVHQFYIEDDHVDPPPSTTAPGGWGAAGGGEDGRS